VRVQQDGAISHYVIPGKIYLLLDIYKKKYFVAMEGKKHKIDTWVSRTNTW
jgi:hypothetical protein